MLETCLENKVINEFLAYYDKNCWQKLIPSLLEIAILNLKSSFNTLFFSEEDIYNIIKDLKIKNKKPFNYNDKPKPRKENIKYIIYPKPSKKLKTSGGWGEETSFKNNRYSQSWRNSKDKNPNNKFKHNYRSRIKDQIDFDKKNYFNNINYIQNKLSQSYNQKERINYAISYDKDLNPEIIERATIKKNKSKKGGKKIIQKMTQEEYEQKYIEENQEYNNENEIYYEENDDGEIYENQRIHKYPTTYKKIKNNQYNNLKISYNKNNKNQKQNNKIQNKNKKNLYHYNNNIIIPNNKVQTNNNSNKKIQNNKISPYNKIQNKNIQNNNINNINNNIKKNNDSKINNKNNININNKTEKISNSQKGKNKKIINNKLNENKNQKNNNLININNDKNNYININNNLYNDKNINNY